jgi:dihydrofolate reductase
VNSDSAKESTVPKLRFRISMSLDGYTAGPRQSVKNPLGEGGEQLHRWVLPLAAWRAPHGLQGGTVDESTPVMEEAVANIGATIMGRNMFGGHPGPWDAAKPWKGWWGDDPPFHHPVFVLTHHPRPPLALGGGTTFTFVTEGIAVAYERALEAADGRDVALAGGADVARQYLNAGLVDEMELSLVPTLLGGGELLFEGVTDLHGLRPVRTIAAPNVTHLKFARR